MSAAVVSDGAAGLIAAIEQIFPTALRQRCLIHRLRNVLAKIPAGMQAEIRDGYWACFDTADLTTEPGPWFWSSPRCSIIAACNTVATDSR